MNFRESYRKEVNGHTHNIALDKRILDCMEDLEDKEYCYASTLFRVGIAVVLCVVLMMKWGTVSGYARNILGQFSFQIGKEVINLSEIEPVEMNVEGHKSYEGTSVVSDTMYSCTYESEAMLAEHAGIEMLKDEELRFGRINVNYSEKAKTLHMTIQVFWKSKEYYMNAMGVVESYGGTEYGYGVEIKPYYVYEYGDGKKAYFVKERGEDSQTIYFVEGGLMYQLAVEKSTEGKQLGKEIVDAMAVD